MTSSKKQEHGKTPDKDAAPAWADGLKKLYDSVVEEPIPDSFKNLLAQFDEVDETDKTSGAGGHET
ncbi:NepR family anti-sigma factor [uncultured Erythrobacter sp.]|uniref:NepR family anti-sigma factor n=1 Tax=uncultured Erythrobacter sp. TaxID=263913 RepID=UPI002621F946|nr:NepR family anti-sigma factor [uncultured Erythrobacter sp.]